MVEIWKEVTDFEGLYEVSNYGNVRSVDRMVNHNKGLQSLKGKPKKTIIVNKWLSQSKSLQGQQEPQ